jgi:preprotein translocase subunit SecY
VLEALMQAFRIPELKKRILFNMAMLAVFVLGAHIPVPGVDHNRLDALFGQGGFLGLVDVFSGGALRKMTVFAMGITPYINASIIMQMLTLAIPFLESLSKEGEAGRKQIAKYTRYGTVVLAVIQAVGFAMSFRAATTGVLGVIQMVVVMTAGTIFLLWVGEQITEKGIGNGVSIVIFAGIMTSLPFQTSVVAASVRNGFVSPISVIVLGLLFVGTILGIVFITQATRRIPIQHVKRVVGMRMTQSGGGSFLPIKVNTAGVIPIIFAISIVLLPAQLLNNFPQRDGFIGTLKNMANNLSPGTTWYAMLIYVVLIVVFTYFYTAVVMNVQEMSDNLKRYGNYIPGIRPGKPTFDYLDRVVSRITLAGAVFLAAVAVVQYIAPIVTGVTSFNLIGGTSLLIVVGVAIESMQAVEAQLLMRNYEGFIKGSGSS